MIQNKYGINYLERKPLVKIEKAPLLVLIHGYGSNEADLFGFAEELPSKYHIVSLQGVLSVPFGGFSWYDINFTDMEKHSNFGQAIESRDKIKYFIEEFIKEENISEEGVTLCGFSQGCILSYSLALYNPDLVQNVIALSGYPELEILPSEIKEDSSKLDFFISHGTEDAVIPIEKAREIQALLTQFKIEYSYKEYPAGHGINQQNYFDMLKWLKTR